MKNVASTLLTFTETTLFARQITQLASVKMLFEIQADLIESPTRHPVIEGTGGARKGRVADPLQGQGKSGGFRYLYLYLEHRGRIYLLYLFGKKEQANLSLAQKRRIKQLVEEIRHEVK